MLQAISVWFRMGGYVPTFWIQNLLQPENTELSLAFSKHTLTVKKRPIKMGKKT
jgi:hypothetical protein